MRITLGVVYIWFGALKLSGHTPVADLVREAVPFPTPDWFVPALGAMEIALGLWFLTGRALLYAAPVFTLHMAGTFGVLLFVPGQAFVDHQLWELTMTGEFVVKNLVLLTAGLLVCLATVPTSPSFASRVPDPAQRLPESVQP
ncbi:DoxX family membrane protein [Streptomyces mangrovisoli]|uniref:DoxX family protein n=1 Tax=Streptomyces mangrovisoli TaxID=1428628 RepID=A0A1J4NRE0_9ACTN|nr:DoxX family membrane protein [Streptomyces mangrovisoli]OIJ65009.1 hypothetical protein WN71_025755 [Streptomyces mangrovisoli]